MSCALDSVVGGLKLFPPANRCKLLHKGSLRLSMCVPLTSHWPGHVGCGPPAAATSDPNLVRAKELADASEHIPASQALWKRSCSPLHALLQHWRCLRRARDDCSI